MFGKRLQAIVQSVGLICFVILAVYGLWSFIARPGALAGAAPAQQAAGAVIPQLVNYQGYLLDGDGKTLDGTHNITFRIYDGPQAGAAVLHEEAHATVQVRNGYFSVLLGDQEGKPLPAGIFANKDRYVGITVAPNPEMTPRQRFASVAYAFTAANADLLDGRDSSSFSPSNLNFLTASDGSPGQAVYVNANGQVGIGTTSPGQELNIKAASGNADLRLTNPNGTSWDMAARGDDASLRFAAVGAADWMTIQRDGDVGIKTTSPAHTLDVNGNINTRSSFLVDGQRPFIIKEVRPPTRQNYDLKVDATKYTCGVFDFRAYGGNINQDDAGAASELIDIDTWRAFDTSGVPRNWLWVDFRTHGNSGEEMWIVTVLCIHLDLVQ